MPKESRWQLLRTQSGRRLEEALQNGNLGGKVRVEDSNRSEVEWYAYPDGDFAAARLTKRPVLVLSQTCDVQNKDYIQVAPVFPAPPADVERLSGGNEFYSAFYLRPHPPEFDHSFADLERMQAVHKSYIRRPLPGVHFRLTDAKTRDLQRFVTRYFGRPNSFDSDTDRVPRTGTYLCVDCFYFDGRVMSRPRTEGEEFGICPACRGTKWVIQGHPRPPLTVFDRVKIAISIFRRPNPSRHS